MCSARTCVCVQAVFTASHLSLQTPKRRPTSTRLFVQQERLESRWLAPCFVFAFPLRVCLSPRVRSQSGAKENHAHGVLTLTALCGRHLGPTTTGEGPLEEIVRRAAYGVICTKNVEATTPSRATQHRHPPSPPQPRRDEGEDCTFFFVRGGCGGTRAPLSCRPANG